VYATPAFRSDGRYLLVLGNPDDTIWNVFARQPYQPYMHVLHATDIHGATFSHDGHTLAWESGGGVTVIRSLDLADWQREACAIANRNLTKDEWQAALAAVS
jgi:hypothetical protein